MRVNWRAWFFSTISCLVEGELDLRERCVCDIIPWLLGALPWGEALKSEANQVGLRRHSPVARLWLI